MCAQVSIYCGYFLTDKDNTLHMQQKKDWQQTVWNSYSRLSFWNGLNSVEYFWNEVRSLLLFAIKRLIMIIFKKFSWRHSVAEMLEVLYILLCILTFFPFLVLQLVKEHSELKIIMQSYISHFEKNNLE